MIYISNIDVSNGKKTNYNIAEKDASTLDLRPPTILHLKKCTRFCCNTLLPIYKSPVTFVAVSDCKKNAKKSSIEYVINAWSDNSVF